MTEKPSSINDDGIFEPFAIDDVSWVDHANGDRFAIRYQQLGDFGGGTDVGVYMEILPPGKQANPAHYHVLEEEDRLILEGSLTLRLSERTYEMAAGHMPASRPARRSATRSSTTIRRPAAT